MKQKIETDILALIVQSFWETRPNYLVSQSTIIKAYQSIPNKDDLNLGQILDIIQDHIDDLIINKNFKNPSLN